MHTRLERTVNCPRNPCVDDISHGTFITRQQETASAEVSFCRTFISSNQDETGTVEQQGAQAFHKALLHRSSIDKVGKNPELMKSNLELRNRIEPYTAKIDALAVIAVEGVLEEQPTKDEVNNLMKAYGLVYYAQPSDPSDQDKLVHAIGPSSTETRLIRPPTSGVQRISSHREEDLLLPLLTAEYKQKKKTLQQAMNQNRMYCVAGVSFLKALGITGYPVFGLVTSGTIGKVILCWHSEKQKVNLSTVFHLHSDGDPTQQRIYLLERNVRTFDIAVPLQAFQFATFVLRLAKYGKEVKDQLMVGENLKVKFYKLARSASDELQWTKEHQFPPTPAKDVSDSL